MVGWASPTAELFGSAGATSIYCVEEARRAEFIQRQCYNLIKQVNDPTCGLRESYAEEDIHPLWVESRNHRLETSNRLTVGYRRDTAEPLP